MIDEAVFRKAYPGTSHDGTVAFYQWVRQHVSPGTILLNLGAGPATGSRIRSFRGEVARAIGVDVDDAVLTNAELDEAHVIRRGRIPLPDDSVDLIVCDYVFEHIADPQQFLGEAHRVLRPGSHLFFRTPNVYHYVSLIAVATPHWFHALVANRARGLDHAAHEPYPTYHRLNTRRRIRREAQRAGFSAAELRMFEGEPSYLMFSRPTFALGVAYERVVNASEALSPLRAGILGKLTR
ncbi:MAG: class I SAM-dependent methyltransferase [Polyangiaceae bacterium]|nr:class I SAM-dependent methyltransferase [Polyangiaceae bacterium]